MTYLSGPMTGLPDLNRPAFDAAARLLRGKGLTVYNPAALRFSERASWEDYMRECLSALVKCRRVVMLPGWEGSRGASLEHQVAQELGMPVLTLAEAGEVEG